MSTHESDYPDVYFDQNEAPTQKRNFDSYPAIFASTEADTATYMLLNKQEEK